MMEHPGIPDMGYAQIFDGFQGFIAKIVEFAHPVIFQSAPRFVSVVGIPEQTGKYLVYIYLHLFLFRFG